MTSGSLVVGLIYRIDTFVTGDDFLNVGASANANTIEFTATGTTPAVWTHSSVLQQITKVPIAAADIANCEVIARQGRSILKSWDKTSAQMLITEFSSLPNFKVLESVALEDLRVERRLGESGEVAESESVKKGLWKGSDYTFNFTLALAN